MDENCKRQKEVERTYGGLLPAVEGHSLGTRYKVQDTRTKHICIDSYSDRAKDTTIPTCLRMFIAIFYIPLNVALDLPCIFFPRGAVAQSVGRATPGEEVRDSIPAVAARSVLVGSVSV